MFRSGNPALRNDAFQPAQTWDDFNANQGGAAAVAVPEGAARVPKERVNHMTIQGTVNKTAILLALVVGSATVTWGLVANGTVPAFAMMLGGGLGGFIVAMIAVFKPKTTPITGPLYALLEGLFVGAFSLIIASMVGDRMGENSPNLAIVFNAVLITFGIAGGVLAAYKTGLVRPTRTFYNVTIALTFGVVIYGLIAMAASFFFSSYSLISVYDPQNGGMISIGFSLFVIILAAANLVLDFDIIANGAANKAPKYMEWYGAFAIMVTLVWLYIEVLRLLSKLQSRD